MNQDEEKLTRRDISRAFNLPPEMYTSPAAFTVEQKAIFSREWIYACRADQVAKRGDYVTLEVGGAPLIVVRDAKGQVRAHSAVCRHRSAIIVEGAGNAKAFRCPYHGWTYALDGTLAAAPLMNKANDFKACDYPLVGVQAQVWENFVFVNLDVDAAPFALRLAPVAALLQKCRTEHMVHVHSVEYQVRTNWKLYVENSMEEYHLPVAHSKTLEPVMPMKEWETQPPGGAYDILTFPRTFYNKVFPRIASTGDDVSTVVLLYPNFLISPSPDSMTTIDHRPVDVAHSRIRIDFFFPKETATHPDFATHVRGNYEALDTVLKEDNIILGLTYRGLESSLSRRGRYAIREQIVHRLHNWLLDRLGDRTGPSSTRESNV